MSRSHFWPPVFCSGSVILLQRVCCLRRIDPESGCTGLEYGAAAGNISEIIDDVLPLSIIVLRADRPEAGQTAENAVKDAEHVASAIWMLAENIAQAAGAEPNSGAGNSARERLYAALEAPYRRWLAALVPGTDTDAGTGRLATTSRAVSRPIVAELISAASPSAWMGRELRNHLVNVALAEAWFNAALRHALPLAQHHLAHTTSEEAAV